MKDNIHGSMKCINHALHLNRHVVCRMRSRLFNAHLSVKRAVTRFDFIAVSQGIAQKLCCAQQSRSGAFGSWRAGRGVVHAGNVLRARPLRTGRVGQPRHTLARGWGFRSCSVVLHQASMKKTPPHRQPQPSLNPTLCPRGGGLLLHSVIYPL